MHVAAIKPFSIKCSPQQYLFISTSLFYKISYTRDTVAEEKLLKRWRFRVIVKIQVNVLTALSPTNSDTALPDKKVIDVLQVNYVISNSDEVRELLLQAVFLGRGQLFFPVPADRFVVVVSRMTVP